VACNDCAVIRASRNTCHHCILSQSSPTSNSRPVHLNAIGYHVPMTPSVRFLLRYPDVVRHRTACASASASRCMRVRAISSSSSQGHIELVKRKTKSLKTRTRVLSCELPSLSVDASGKPRAGLGKWNERHGGIAGIAIRESSCIVLITPPLIQFSSTLANSYPLAKPCNGSSGTASRLGGCVPQSSGSG